MSNSPISNAIANRDNGPGALIEQYRGDFSTVLPAHIKGDTWVRLAQGVLRRDKNLARIATSNPGSFMSALLECARLGHEPGTSAYYLVPFGNEIQGIEGYVGKIDRIYRAGAVSSVVAEVVHEHDHFAYKPGPGSIPEHEIDWGAERGPLRLVYAYAQMKEGSVSRVIVLTKTEVEKHMRESKGWDKPSSPWQRWQPQMWLKTAVHELEKWVPSSTEYLRERLRAAQDVAAEQARPAAPGPAVPQPVPPADHDEVVEGELMDEEER
ncbi:hypothetical protein GCM10010406_21610 [Streptomyces thermolineatus]|uniref:Recombinase RecT n=1 Tax=Streptomyces thermolineatus TaxID=44033 RepID=A0ABN3LLK4_9ACTN